MADLQSEGPVLEVTLALTAAASAAMATGGQPLPTPIKASAMVDTGASHSVVQAGLLGPLGLHPVGSSLINTPSSEGVSCNLYAVRIVLPNGNYIDSTVIEAPLQGQNIQALIGRDVLQHGILIYQGHLGQFTLSF